MISRLVRSSFVLLGIALMLSACGGGGGSSGSSSGGSTPPQTQTPTVSSITVGPSNAEVVAGLTLQLTATAIYSDGSQKDISSTATWSSSDTAKATVSGLGLATGVAAGTSSLSAVWSGVTGSNTLTVQPPNLVSVVISPSKPSVGVGTLLQFKATGSYTDGSTQDLTSSAVWNSSVTATATMGSAPNSVGLATAAGLGTTEISATVSGMSPAPATMTVTATIYAYATNFDDDTVSQYVLGGTGALAPLATASVATGHKPFSITMESTGQFVYVSNWGSSDVSQYRIGADGNLTAIGSGTVASGTNPNAVTLDHAERFAYVANLGDSTISQYRVGLDGALAPLSTPTVAGGPNPASISIDPTNHFAYVANFNSGSQDPLPGPSTLSQYSIGANGALTPLSAPTIPSGSGPNSLTVDPTGKYLYVVNLGDDNVGQYTINSDGSLAAMSTATVPAGARPFGIAVDPSARYVYVANHNDNTISQYTIGNDGALAPMTPATVATDAGVSAVTVDPTGKYLYATNRGTTTISQYNIGVAGALTPMTTPTVASGLHPTAIATGY